MVRVGHIEQWAPLAKVLPWVVGVTSWAAVSYYTMNNIVSHPTTTMSSKWIQATEEQKLGKPTEGAPETPVLVNPFFNNLHVLPASQ